MRDLMQGRPFHGTFSSADASALAESAARFSLWGNQGATAKTTITLKSNEQVVITDIEIDNESISTLVVQLYDGANNAIADGGEQICKFKVPTLTSRTTNLLVPHYCLEGTYPKVKTDAAGQVDVTIRGVIIRNGQ